MALGKPLGAGEQQRGNPVLGFAARPPVVYVHYPLPDGIMGTVSNLPPGGHIILGAREAESVEAWQRDNPPPE